MLCVAQKWEKMKKKIRAFIILITIAVLGCMTIGFGAIVIDSGSFPGSTYNETIFGDAGHLTAIGTGPNGTYARSLIQNDSVEGNPYIDVGTQRRNYYTDAVLEWSSNSGYVPLHSTISTPQISRNSNNSSEYIKHDGFLEGYDNYLYHAYSFVHK